MLNQYLYDASIRVFVHQPHWNFLPMYTSHSLSNHSSVPERICMLCVEGIQMFM